MLRLRYLAVACLIVLFFRATPCQADLQLQGYQANRNDRFYVGADRAFVGEEFNWSGVGQVGGGTWATMISPTYFVSATHWHPSGGDSITFYEGNDPAGPSHQYTVDSWGYQATTAGVGSDLWLGKLTTPLATADHIAYYPVLTLPTSNDYVGQIIFVNGKPNRVGRNAIDRITTAQEPSLPSPPSKNTTVMEFGYDTPGLGSDEAYLIGGDSGGPDFIDVNGHLALVGIHYYNGGTPLNIPDISQTSGSSFVPYYVTQLDTQMSGESITTIVPEPASFILLGLGSLALLRRRKQPARE